jgi:hypothetical protein
MEKYTECAYKMHKTQVVPFAETLSIVIDTSGKGGTIPQDATLEGRTILGFRATIQDAQGHGADENGKKLLSRERAASAFLELWANGTTRAMKIPLSMLLNASTESNYFKVYMKGFSALKSKISFGENIAATEEQAVLLTVITEN